MGSYSHMSTNQHYPLLIFLLHAWMQTNSSSSNFQLVSTSPTAIEQSGGKLVTKAQHLEVNQSLPWCYCAGHCCKGLPPKIQPNQQWEDYAFITFDLWADTIRKPSKIPFVSKTHPNQQCPRMPVWCYLPNQVQESAIPSQPLVLFYLGIAIQALES